MNKYLKRSCPSTRTRRAARTLRVALSLFCLFGLLFLFVHCSPESMTETVVKKEILPNSGETLVLGPKGMKVIIPNGAVIEPMTFAIRELSASTVADNRDYELLSPYFLLTPEGYQFERPITIELSFVAGERSIAAQKARVAAFSTPLFEDKWQRLDGSVDTDLHIYRAQTTHLGVFAVFDTGEKDALQPDGDTDETRETEVETEEGVEE